MEDSNTKTFPVLLATGKTYPYRRELRAAGGVWLDDEKGYALPLAASVSLPGVTIEQVTLDRNPFAPLSRDELRAQRQARIDRKKARLLDRAQRADRRSDEAMDRISSGERDFLRLAEPVKIGHHSQGKHQRLIERYRKAMDKSVEENIYANKLRRRAEWLEDAKVAGDAEERRKRETEAIRATLGAGDTVVDCFFGQGVIVKMNPKSVSVRFGNSVRNCAARQLTLVSKGTQTDASDAKLVHRFKKADKVKYNPIGNQRDAWDATILRRTPRGYTIEYTLFDKLRKKTVREDEVWTN